jgi:ketosteroid isomerase-like protein
VRGDIATIRTIEERVRCYYRLVDAGRVSELVVLFAEHAVYHRPGYSPLVGQGSLAEFYHNERVIQTGRHDLTGLLIQPGQAAVHGDFTGILKDGSRVRLRFADFFVFTDEALIERRETFFFTPMV